MSLDIIWSYGHLQELCELFDPLPVVQARFSSSCFCQHNVCRLRRFWLVSFLHYWWVSSKALLHLTPGSLCVFAAGCSHPSTPIIVVCIMLSVDLLLDHVVLPSSAWSSPLSLPPPPPPPPSPRSPLCATMGPPVVRHSEQRLVHLFFATLCSDWSICCPPFLLFVWLTIVLF